MAAKFNSRPHEDSVTVFQFQGCSTSEETGKPKPSVVKWAGRASGGCAAVSFPVPALSSGKKRPGSQHILGYAEPWRCSFQIQGMTAALVGYIWRSLWFGTDLLHRRWRNRPTNAALKEWCVWTGTQHVSQSISQCESLVQSEFIANQLPVSWFMFSYQPWKYLQKFWSEVYIPHIHSVFLLPVDVQMSLNMHVSLIFL